MTPNWTVRSEAVIRPQTLWSSDKAKVAPGYTGPLYRVHSKAEKRATHAEFTRRLHEAD